MMEPDIAILRQYMTNNKLLDSNVNHKPLFCNAPKKKLTRSGLHYVLQCDADIARKQAANLIPVRLSCHSLRHSKAFHLLQVGVNLIYIRDILSHQSVKTTEIYARADSKQKREVLEKAYPNVVAHETPVWSNNDNLLAWLKEFK